jgi:hypothetical protein
MSMDSKTAREAAKHSSSAMFFSIEIAVELAAASAKALQNTSQVMDPSRRMSRSSSWKRLRG